MNGDGAGTDGASPADGGLPSPARRRKLQRLAAAFGPIVLGVVFFGVLSPIGVILRIAGRDRLQLRSRRGTESYWLPVAARGLGR
jgi:hypothetical protein